MIRRRAEGGGRKPSPRHPPEACRQLIPGPAAATAARLEVTRQAVEQVWKKGATVALIKRWQSILRGESLGPKQIKSIARRICGGWLNVCLSEGFQVAEETADEIGRPITEAEERAIFQAIDEVITDLTGKM